MGQSGRRLLGAAALAGVGLAAGVVGSAAQETPPPSGFTIVGEWLGLHDCERIVPMLRGAGLDEFVLEAVVGNGLIPGVGDPAAVDGADPCAGAVPRSHSHFFTDSGTFGSRDFHGAQVDDGQYTVDGDTLTINGSDFGFSLDGDALTLEPGELATDCTTQECRFGNAWRLMVSLPGATWVRVP